MSDSFLEEMMAAGKVSQAEVNEMAARAALPTLARSVARVLGASKSSTVTEYAPNWKRLVEGRPDLCPCVCPQCLDTRPNAVCGCGRHDHVPELVESALDGKRFHGLGDQPAAWISLIDLEGVELWVRTFAIKRIRARNAKRLKEGLAPRPHDGRSAVETYVTAMRYLWKRLCEDPASKVTSNPALKLVKPKRSATGPRALSGDQLDAVYDTVLDHYHDPALAFLLISLGVETGARAGAIEKLCSHSLDAQRCWIAYTGDKNGDTRRNPVSAALTADLVAHYVQRSGDPTFVGMDVDDAVEAVMTGRLRMENGRPLLYRRDRAKRGAAYVPITTRVIENLVVKIRTRSLMANELDLRFHDFRKTGSSAMERAGGYAIAARFLGHAPEATTTGMYTQAGEHEFEACFRNLFDRQ